MPNVIDYADVLFGSDVQVLGTIRAAAIEAPMAGPVAGDVIGNVTGDVTGDLTGNVKTESAEGIAIESFVASADVAIGDGEASACDEFGRLESGVLGTGTTIVDLVVVQPTGPLPVAEGADPVATVAVGLLGGGDLTDLVEAPVPAAAWLAAAGVYRPTATKSGDLKLLVSFKDGADAASLPIAGSVRVTIFGRKVTIPE